MSNAFFHKAELCNPLFLSFRELVRVRARTFCAKTARDCSRAVDFGLSVTFRLLRSDTGHTGIAGSLCNGICYRTDDLLVERHRHDILRVQLLIGNAGRDRLSRCQLHLVVDVAGAHIQRPAENTRESQHVVDLVRVVRTAGADNGSSAPSLRPSGQISGTGFAIANTIGSFFAMVETISAVSTCGADMPKNTSAPLTASASVPVMCSRLVTFGHLLLCRIQTLIAPRRRCRSAQPS